jgi:signal transduction histidine kinase
MVQRSFAPLLRYLPRGNMLDDAEWMRRHVLLQWLLAAHLPALFVFGVAMHWSPLTTAAILVPPLIFLVLGHEIPRRRPASLSITGGLTYCSAALTVLAHGSIEAHFHFFIIIGFIALYQDWVPFIWNVLFTVLSHGLGSVWRSNLIFNYVAAQRNPWVWSAIHGVAVLAACAGMVIFWRVSEDQQQERERAHLMTQRAGAEADRRRFTSDLLVNLARRNQSMLYRQLDIINQLEEKESDPDALADLFRLDHLATRVRRNAESLLVLSGEQSARVWGTPVPLHEVVRAAIAETQDLERVNLAVDESVAVTGRSVTDLTHLLAELTENAVRFSPPRASVTIRSRAQLGTGGAHLITVEDWGIGISAERLAAYNVLLADPPEVDVQVPQQLGFHVVARLASRHGITVSLTQTAGGGLTAAVILPVGLIKQLTTSALAQRPPFERRVDPVAGPAGPMRDETANGAIPRSSAGLDTVTAVRPIGIPGQAGAPMIEIHSRRRNGTTLGELLSRGSATPTWGGWWSLDDHADGPASGPGQDAERWDPSAEGARSPEAAPPSTDERSPVAAPSPADGPPSRIEEAGDGEPRLRRRVPQTHLAPELRVPDTPSPAPSSGAPPPRSSEHLSDAAYALSHYQASRNAAQEQGLDKPHPPVADDEVDDRRPRGDDQEGRS